MLKILLKMPKTQKQRIILYKAVNRKRDRLILRFAPLLAKAIMDSIEPVIDQVEITNSFSPDMLILITEDAIFNAMLKLYNATIKPFAKIVNNRLTQESKKAEFSDFTLNQIIIDLLNDDGPNGIGFLITQMTEQTKQDVAKTIVNAITGGVSGDDLAKILASRFKKISVTRGRMIARTEVVRASNKGSVIGAESSGVPFIKEWNSVLDSRTRTGKFNHRVVDGQKRDRNKPFNVSGERLDFPTDTSHGASAGNTIQCRCVVDFIPENELSTVDDDIL